MALDNGECFDKGLKSVVAAELQGLEKRWQHAPVVANKLLLHDGLPEQTQLWAADVELGHQIPKDLLFNSREDHLAYDPVGGARLRSRPPGTKFASCPRHVQGKRATVGGCASPSVHLSGGSVAILVTSSVTSRARTCKKHPM